MEYYRDEEDSVEEDFQEDHVDDEEILDRYYKLKIFRKILAILAVVFFVGVFVAPELARYLPFLAAGPKTPDYVSLVTDFDGFVRFDPGTVRFSIVYEAYYNRELLESTFRAAAADWENALGRALHFEWAEEGEAPDLLIVVVENLPHPGRTYMEFVGERYRPRVELNAAGLSEPYVLRLVVAHELGHALGLWGHSDYPGDLMYPAPVRADPSKRDVLTLRRIYGIE